MNKIVIVEDDIRLRKKIASVLKINRYEVREVATAEEAIVAIRQKIPDLIISDIMLEGISGIELKDELNNDDLLELIPFIFLTAKNELEDIRFGMSLGADDYLTKPFKINDLLNTVKLRIEKTGKILSSKKLVQKTYDDYKYYFKYRNELKGVFIKDIRYIEAKGSYSLLHLNDNSSYTIRKYLKEWEEGLPNEKFIRISRSVIINKDFVDSLEKNEKNIYVIKLNESETEFIISRKFTKAVKKEIFNKNLFHL